MIAQTIQNMHLMDPDDVIRSKGRMPFVASVIDASKNIGSSVNLGWNAASLLGGDGFRTGGNIARYGASIGGALTLGGGIVPGAIAGAAIGVLQDGGDIGTTAAIGAGIGLAVPIGIGAAGYGINKLGTKLITSHINSVSDIGSVGEKAADIGKGFAKAGKFAFDMIDNPIARGQMNALGKFSKHIVKFDKVKLDNITKEPLEGLESVKLGWAGNMMFYGGAIKEAASKAFNTYMHDQMGTVDPYITKVTPQIPAYADNSGADGSLVFALNKNRRG